MLRYLRILHQSRRVIFNKLHKTKKLQSILSITHFSTSSTYKTALVTGGNRGIGLQVCKQLCDNDYNVIMSTRDLDRGNTAIEKYFHKDRRDKISLLKLDINDEGSINEAVKNIEQNYDNIDVLVNNAGIHYDYGIWVNSNLSKKDKIINTISTNYYGTMDLTYKLLPHLSNSRIICLSNRDSALTKLSSELRDAFLNDDLDEAGLNDLMEYYQQDAINGDHSDDKHLFTTKRGWLNSYYLMSYVGVNIFCKILGNTLKSNAENTNWVAAYCPGHCATDSTDYFGDRQPSESAFGVITLSKMMLQEETPNGKFWAAFYSNDNLEDVELQIMDLTHPTDTVSWDTLCGIFVLDPKIESFE